MLRLRLLHNYGSEYYTEAWCAKVKDIMHQEGKLCSHVSRVQQVCMVPVISVYAQLFWYNGSSFSRMVVVRSTFA